MKVSADILSNLNTDKKLGCCEWLEQGATLSKCGDKLFYHEQILFNRSKHFSLAGNTKQAIIARKTLS
jgi:hypothetical protein